MSPTYNTLERLGQLALEYDQKYRELEQLAEDAQQDDLLVQLKVFEERTTDRFRAAQQKLLAVLSASENSEQDQEMKAIMVLSSCFDEIRILFQILHRLTLTSSQKNRACRDA